MCDVPFFPIFPICFQCGTDQNPCHCKVVGPTLGNRSMLTAFVDRILFYHHRGSGLLASFDLLWLWLYQDWTRVCPCALFLVGGVG
ncbi:Nucleic acid-binding OB-fold [Penicillium atrosanguineum]|uniref:Nucleic acid-binding OB-fold n=1 Tax=Penicillium atrosanguineum TaxID=1132637 RepID=UPI002383AA53|nr:Nucleic acid-binding OB-fold [Penicillium atrosanguineum]KAJ5141410.1 hypothetical protein N7526_002405 [Penicillium atrosanguineum]KAJ5290368.1 Nucleic acid-binding OB-fold [Penicillium atrosanguineum]